MSDSKIYAAEPDYICLVKRDPEKGYIFDLWIGEKKPDNVSADDIADLISWLNEGEWKNGWLALWYPKEIPLWFVHITRKEIVLEGERPEFEFELRWYTIPKEKKDEKDEPVEKTSVFLKVLLCMILIAAGGMVGAFGYKYWEEQQTQVPEPEPEVAVETKELLEKWKEAESYFGVFDKVEVREYRKDKKSELLLGTIELSEDNKRYRVDLKVSDYDKIYNFLEAMKDFAFKNQTH